MKDWDECLSIIGDDEKSAIEGYKTRARVWSR